MKKLIVFLILSISLVYAQDILFENIFQYEIYKSFTLELPNCERITVYADKTGIFELRTQDIFYKDIYKYCLRAGGREYYIDMRTKTTYIVIPIDRGLRLIRY